MKAHVLLENQKELGLTDDQVKTIKNLKLQVEKDEIRQNADRETFMLDLKSKLHEDKIDVEGAKALIDKNYLAAASAAKSNLDAYAQLKNTLTPAQEAKIKELWEKKSKSWSHPEHGSASSEK